MRYYLDVKHLSLNKYGEELCGDHIETAENESGMILVLSDGLGSGVKANILATLTAKIAVTMLKENASLEDTIETITKTLPVCSVRKLAYSTFTIVMAENTGKVRIVEFDNPSYFHFRNGKLSMPQKTRQLIHGKEIHLSELRMRPGDYLTVISDGVVHAGVGKLLNFGWQWENIRDYIENLALGKSAAGTLAHEVLGYTGVLYDLKPGDDASILCLAVKEKKVLNLFAGPPNHPEDDALFVKSYMEAEGLKVIAGGTTAGIISRELGKSLDIDLQEMRKNLPPSATMEGADLVTEGVLTLGEVIRILEVFDDEKKSMEFLKRLSDSDGAARLCRLILDESTEVRLFMGTAVNPAHQEPGFSYNFNYKVEQIKKLKELMEKSGRRVELYTI
ncbi:SpoIIE family protein phosphatase [Proteiniclasticum sp. SCR006]|uniref:SpoIIE family protein phosphatase n=1 Tax=Proteiniclasticum aestuarii TaxID=2817862 RepID=A0A939KG34_9CLOT|nr:SpoIIE family protein phosphatase [Proteiniclasticum aestuarii]MBO1263954.1 SpoIIE family protein phosphatase [Proteiniclasticum aestuarii]